jgi:hypothetical protein
MTLLKKTGVLLVYLLVLYSNSSVTQKNKYEYPNCAMSTKRLIATELTHISYAAAITFWFTQDLHGATSQKMAFFLF